MATIVEYTNRKSPQNEYPRHIISPSHAGPCCFSDMDEVGVAEQDGRWVFQYRRCRECGFTVRAILREIPDAVRADELRHILAHAFVRNVPDL